MKMLWPVLLIVSSNILYHIIAKQTPEDVNPLFSLTITYAVAAVFSAVLYAVTSRAGTTGIDPGGEFSRLNWTSFLFGLCIVGLEFGYINVYRVGWKISLASLVANISLAVVLLLVGVLFYREQISLRQLLGIVLCAAGLALISR